MQVFKKISNFRPPDLPKKVGPQAKRRVVAGYQISVAFSSVQIGSRVA
jgi:hypothetical protein